MCELGVGEREHGGVIHSREAVKGQRRTCPYILAPCKPEGIRCVTFRGGSACHHGCAAPSRPVSLIFAPLALQHRQPLAGPNNLDCTWAGAAKRGGAFKTARFAGAERATPPPDAAARAGG